jgi:hypothetical protein
MMPPYPFQHIRIEDVWPPWDALCQYAKEVIRKGSGEIWGPYVPPEFRKWTPAKVAASLTPHGCLQVALRCTEPFKDCDDDHARALHYDRGKACRCHNRSGLIEGLADALLEYENRLNIWMSDIREMPETMKQALSTLKAAAYTYEMLRERRLAPKLPSPNKITDALQTLTTLTEVLTSEHYRLVTKSAARGDSINLLTQMYGAFVQHGPSPKDYPAIAIYMAIAAILIQLGVEKKGKKSSLETVAERLRKRLARTSHPA